MLEQTGNALPCVALFLNSGAAATGLTVTVDVFRWNGSSWTQIVTAGSATEIGDGAYSYQLASGSNTVEGLYLFVFKTTGTADQKAIAVGWAVSKAGVEHLDVDISSRAASGTTVSLTSPVASSSVGYALSLVQGDDYSAATVPIDFTFATLPYSLVGATSVTLTPYKNGVAQTPWNGTVLSATQLRFTATAAVTGALDSTAAYVYVVKVTLSTGEIRTLVISSLTVLVP